jgi:hypothetical protein
MIEQIKDWAIVAGLAVFATACAIGGALFIATCVVLGIAVRLAPVVIIVGLAWAISEHQGWVDLVEWM